jgi:hypothetical protein
MMTKYICYLFYFFADIWKVKYNENILSEMKVYKLTVDEGDT